MIGFIFQIVYISCQGTMPKPRRGGSRGGRGTRGGGGGVRGRGRGSTRGGGGIGRGMRYEDRNLNPGRGGKRGRCGASRGSYVARYDS